MGPKTHDYTVCVGLSASDSLNEFPQKPKD